MGFTISPLRQPLKVMAKESPPTCFSQSQKSKKKGISQTPRPPHPQPSSPLCQVWNASEFFEKTLEDIDASSTNLSVSIGKGHNFRIQPVKISSRKTICNPSRNEEPSPAEYLAAISLRRSLEIPGLTENAERERLWMRNYHGMEEVAKINLENSQARGIEESVEKGYFEEMEEEEGEKLRAKPSNSSFVEWAPMSPLPPADIQDASQHLRSCSPSECAAKNRHGRYIPSLNDQAKEMSMNGKLVSTSPIHSPCLGNQIEEQIDKGPSMPLSPPLSDSSERKSALDYAFFANEGPLQDWELLEDPSWISASDLTTSYVPVSPRPPTPPPKSSPTPPSYPCPSYSSSHNYPSGTPLQSLAVQSDSNPPPIVHCKTSTLAPSPKRQNRTNRTFVSQNSKPTKAQEDISTPIIGHLKLPAPKASIQNDFGKLYNKCKANGVARKRIDKLASTSKFPIVIPKPAVRATLLDDEATLDDADSKEPVLGVEKCKELPKESEAGEFAESEKCFILEEDLEPVLDESISDITVDDDDLISLLDNLNEELTHSMYHMRNVDIETLPRKPSTSTENNCKRKRLASGDKNFVPLYSFSSATTGGDIDQDYDLATSEQLYSDYEYSSSDGFNKELKLYERMVVARALWESVEESFQAQGLGEEPCEVHDGLGEGPSGPRRKNDRMGSCHKDYDYSLDCAEWTDRRLTKEEWLELMAYDTKLWGEGMTAGEEVVMGRVAELMSRPDRGRRDECDEGMFVWQDGGWKGKGKEERDVYMSGA